jgi:hypothetical protein
MQPCIQRIIGILRVLWFEKKSCDLSSASQSCVFKHILYETHAQLFPHLFACTQHSTIDLKVEHQTEALGLDDATPRLTWRMEGKEEKLAHTTYQILFATSEAKLAPKTTDLWDSGEVKSNQTSAIYAGKALPSSSWIYWTVRTWSGKTASE